MNISAHARHKLVRIGKHEAAHYVAAKKLGFETGDLSLELTHLSEGHNGGSLKGTEGFNFNRIKGVRDQLFLI